MPLRKKKNTASVRNIAILALVAVLLILMIISFPPVQNITEIVLYP